VRVLAAFQPPVGGTVKMRSAQEAAVSRLYGGVHFRFANEDGLQSGLGLGEFTFSHFVRRKCQRSRK